MNNRTIKLYFLKAIKLIISCENYIFFYISADKDNFIVHLTLNDYEKPNFITVCPPCIFLLFSYEATVTLAKPINRGDANT